MKIRYDMMGRQETDVDKSLNVECNDATQAHNTKVARSLSICLFNQSR